MYPVHAHRNWLCFASMKPDLLTLTSYCQVNYAKLRLALFCHFSDVTALSSIPQYRPGTTILSRSPSPGTHRAPPFQFNSARALLFTSN